ncbi:NAD(P)H-dependent glycerol-3-phosphate dehydrogenase [Spiroplasma sabaudiense Ar-1343]|uniref:Glycerol-3-phosphate dehydrogenase [NAD(P)+] n=1 Tax=Spiroplasma sabaudiense Ar-1343 TaxID=1276257 RepID=W6A9K4_9MOLU|nr:NAD(P)H-dependent glycerol-3-phosphate dehydrogenase [Spiroplasma sabaudiense]AHI53666.1 NAD(P)H-dependent glycerol-3-phosphate dehydrogenase [Spiroplasma sabaudiense Ar-1343]
MKNVTIIGTGAYGTVLANVLADNSHKVVMYGIDENQVMEINDNHKNPVFFQDALLNKNIKATTDLPAALEKTEILVLGVPTLAIDKVVTEIIKYAKNKMIIINVAKGLDEENLDVLSKKVIKMFANTNIMESYGALFGPSVAIEVIQRKPTCIMSCSEDIKVAKKIAEIFNNEYFRVLPTDDLIGCEIAAALKNTVAIASGIMFGFESSDNSKASLITIGHNEIKRLSLACGAKPETSSNFAALGDLILTATSRKSRNFGLGMEIAAANDAATVLNNYKTTVEGVTACKIAYKMAKKMKINLPLFELVYEILYNNSMPSATINNVFKDIILV